ncbi:hypothetical protein PV773_05945 [Mesorhizobium sp. CC13]|uniref:hypothetical protein n=1 Tax=Mesorhizobium sp. CC13 TaxID=3029194 RepID=UPI00326776C4
MMLTSALLHAQLERMEAGLAETRRTLVAVERKLEIRAEAETIRRRPKARYCHRRMSRWTGADEAEYRRVLDAMLSVTGPELDRLRRRADRQDAAIEALRRKYRVNEERPLFSVR